MLPPVIQHEMYEFWYLSMCFRYMGAEVEVEETPHCTSSTMSRAECRMKGLRARDAASKRATPSPPDRDVPNSCSKRGLSFVPIMAK